MAAATEKPSKPRPDFPLFAHAAGRWAKKIRGKMHYFGPWSDPDGALAKYEREKVALHAGLPLDIGDAVARYRSTGERGNVYAIAARLTCPHCRRTALDVVKLGHTMNLVSDRLRGMQTGSPVALELLGVMPGGEEVEGELHRHFHGARQSGEWFDHTPELRDFITEQMRGLHR